MRAKTISAVLDDGPTEQVALAGLALATLTHDDNYFRDVLEALPAAVYITDAAGHITFFNEAAAELWGHRPHLGTSDWCGSWKLFAPDGSPMPHDQCPMAIALKQNRPIRGMEAVAERPDGTRVSFIPFPTPLRDATGTLVGAVNMLVEITERKSAEEKLLKQTRRLAALDRIAKAISGSLQLEQIVQTVTEAAAELSGAQFGAFFYNMADGPGEGRALYILAGAPQATFETFAPPRGATILDPTFRGGGIVRSDDIRSDPRYGRCDHCLGLPMGHRPVVSYLAVPVVSRSGDIHGALVFGHERPGVFTPESEEIVAALAAHAAIAVDNFRVLNASRVEVENHRRAEEAAHLLAAIVESSDDAILAKNLDGIITSWNQGATRLFGYTADEVIGKSVTILIPLERHDEEPRILGRIRRGERVDHYETIRRRKDGSLVEISLTVSPVKRADGTIIGASKIARDITERRRAQQQQSLLLREMDHRIKNLFTLSSSVVSLSARSARTPLELASAVRDRLGALARAHALTLSKPGDARREAEPATSLHALIRTIASPYDQGIDQDETRIAVSGPDISLAGDCVTAFALLLHEFATNAAKYGALSTEAGHVDVQCSEADDQFVLTWTEHGGPCIEHAAESEGFGSLLARVTVKGQLDGEISRDWKRSGLVIRLSVARGRITG